MKTTLTWLTIILISQSILSQETQSLEKLPLDSLENIINKCNKQGNFKKGLPYYVEYSNRIKTEHGEASKEYVDVVSDIAYIYEVLGDFEKADLYYLETLKAYKSLLGQESELYAVHLCYYGDFLKIKGDYESAEKMLLEALEIGERNRKKFKSKVNFAALYGFLGNYYSTLNQYEKALPLYLENFKIYQDSIGEKNPEYGASASNLGRAYAALGLKEKALELFEKAVETTEKYHGTKNYLYGQRVNNLALEYPKTEENRLLLDSLFRISVKNAAKNLGKESPEYARRLENHGTNYFDYGDYEKAMEIYLTCRTLYSKNYEKGHVILFKNAVNVSKTYTILGQLDSAKNILLEALDFEDNAYKFSDEKLAILENAGRLFEKLGLDYLLPDFYFQKNEYFVNILKNQFDQFSEFEQISFEQKIRHNFDEFESFAFQNPDKKEFLNSAMNNQFLLKGLFLNNKNRLVKSIQNSNPETVKKFKEWQKLKVALSKEYALSPNRRSDNFKEMVTRADELESELARLSEPFKEANKFTTWEEIQAALKPGEVLIEFSEFEFLTGERTAESKPKIYVAYLLKSGDREPQMIPLFKEKEMPALRKTKTLYSFQKRTNTQNLYDLVWQPLSKHLEGVKTVYYTPSGVLYSVNFGAIPVSENEIVADRFELHNLSGSRELIFPFEQPKQDSDALIFGGIEYNFENENPILTENAKPEPEGFSASRSLGNSFRALRGEDWQYLAWTEKEANEIQKILESSNMSVTAKKGLEANEESFKKIGQSGKSPQIIHLATHGYFFPKADSSANSGFQASRHPLIRSGLILAGANAAWKGEGILSGTEDGILTAYEIAQTDLSQTELVVLSACDTGLGEIEGKEGVFGLQRAFKSAGAKYLLMSLWKVNDADTYDFMTTFYRYRKEKNKTIPEAYLAAQNYMRTLQPNNPRAWAGFILSK